jgi:hypothetical protein
VKTLIDIRSNYQVPGPNKSGPWDQQIEELDNFFNATKFPDSIQLDKCSVIVDVPLFVKSHLSILKGQNGNQRYKPYLDRLIQLMTILSPIGNDEKCQFPD